MKIQLHAVSWAQVQEWNIPINYFWNNVCKTIYYIYYSFYLHCPGILTNAIPKMWMGTSTPMLILSCQIKVFIVTELRYKGRDTGQAYQGIDDSKRKICLSQIAIRN